MKRCAALLLFSLVLAPSAGADWLFGERIAVTADPAAGVFHHLDGAGR